MAEENQEMKGDPFFQRLGMKGPAKPPDKSEKTRAQEFEAKTAAAEAEDNYRTTVERINNPPSLKEMQAKQIEEMQSRAREAEARAKEAEDKAREADQEARKEAERVAAEARAEARAAEKALQDHQLAMLSQKLDDALAKQGSFQQQFDEYFGFADLLATKMGYQRPGITQPATDNPQIALEVVKLQIQDAQHQREHDRQMEKDKRDWDVKLEEIRETRAYNQAQLDLDRQKAGMLAQLPESIGGAIIKGVVDRRSGQVGTRVQSQPEPQQKTYKISLDVGEANEFECPHCKTAIAVGPTSTAARCLGCNAQFPIERVQAHEPSPPGV